MSNQVYVTFTLKEKETSHVYKNGFRKDYYYIVNSKIHDEVSIFKMFYYFAYEPSLNFSMIWSQKIMASTVIDYFEVIKNHRKEFNDFLRREQRVRPNIPKEEFLFNNVLKSI